VLPDGIGRRQEFNATIYWQPELTAGLASIGAGGGLGGTSDFHIADVGACFYTAGMRATRVTPEAIADVAEAVAEKIDVLLERAADTLIAAPRPGSPQWHTAWEARESLAGQAALEERILVKIAVALSAGVDPGHEITRAHRAGVPWNRIAAAAGTCQAGRPFCSGFASSRTPTRCALASTAWRRDSRRL
jgi:hypothetical protein